MVQRIAVHPKPSPRFIEPMECKPVPKLPEGDAWVYEPKQDREFCFVFGFQLDWNNRNPSNPRNLSAFLRFFSLSKSSRPSSADEDCNGDTCAATSRTRTFSLYQRGIGRS